MRSDRPRSARPTSARSASVRAINDRGAGTVLALVVLPVVSLGFAVLWAFVDVSMVRTKAAGAADLAALAGAAHASEGVGAACAKAEEIAMRNSARLVSCEMEGLDLVVEVTVAATGFAARFSDWVGGHLPDVRHRSRAGP